MKRIVLFFIFALEFCFNGNAQVRVDNQGNLGINANSSTLWSPLCINTYGNPSYAITSIGNKSGIYSENNGNESSWNYGGLFIMKKAHNAQYNIGIEGRSDDTPLCDSVRFTYGVIGRAGYGSANNIGVLGRISNSSHGAAIYGTLYGYDDGVFVQQEQQKYAGYFVGDVRVRGNIALTGTVQGAMLGQSASYSNGNADEDMAKKTSMADKMSGLFATYYQIEPEIINLSSSNSFLMDEQSWTTNTPKTIEKSQIEKQIEEKTHYALCAEQLEKVFPDLVYEQEDGTKRINYIEMIPLLVQSINELNVRISELEGNEFSRRMEASGYNGINNSNKMVSRLYQNNPNPFKEKTVIRFQLADDARDAAICIFDMSGKMLKKLPISWGMESVSINGYELGEGMFLYSLVVNGNEIDTKRMIISK